MNQYLELMRQVLEHGAEKGDRTGTGTRSLFGWQMRFDLADGFPLVTTKRLHLPSIIHELLWFLSGDTSTDYLHRHGVSIWDEWADESGNLGPIYGAQWRAWPGRNGDSIDQLAQVVEQIRKNPDSRRLVVSAWNVADLPDESLTPQENVGLGNMALAPCHTLIQFYVSDGKLSCQLYQRSCDIFLGVPFNIASYALLTHMVAQQCDLVPGEFIWTGGDVHLYANHLEQARQQLERAALPLPELRIKRRPPTLFDYRYDDFSFENYRFHPPIKAPVAI